MALEKLEGQYPQSEQMAAMLNLSARSYRRRLETEDTSFQCLLIVSDYGMPSLISENQKTAFLTRQLRWDLLMRRISGGLSSSGVVNHRPNGARASGETDSRRLSGRPTGDFKPIPGEVQINNPPIRQLSLQHSAPLIKEH